MTDYRPTLEQQAVIDACRTGGNLVVEAAAGAGKTSTLRLAAAELRGRILYVAYNKAAATEAQRSFPSHVKCSTVHALAYGAVGRQYTGRLRDTGRSTLRQTAERLDVRNHVEIGSGILLTPFAVTRIAMDTVRRFCQSADRELSEKHIPRMPGIFSVRELARLHAQLGELRAEGRHAEHAAVHAVWDNGLRSRADLARAVLPVAQRAWADLQDPDGRMIRFEHDHYLKLWQLTDPMLPYDVVMLDEAQDSNPVTSSIVTNQQGQRIAIGDGCQQLYAWRGAVDALATWPAETRLYLTQSWRFGEAIANEANKWLTLLGTDMRVRGNPNLASTIGRVPTPAAVLCRTNAGAVAAVMTFLENGRVPALVGGADDLVRMAEAARDLKAGRPTSHPELFPFKTWTEVVQYSEESEGADLRVFVRLVDEHGPTRIIDALTRTVGEDQAQVVVSTAHRSKGREWPTVTIADDFPEPTEDEEIERADAMLAYVAVTRAKTGLDLGGLAWIDRYTPAGVAA
jgi:superfamily I DNA/RNA helicase